MAKSKINRYILKEISIPALLSLLIFTFVILMGRIPRLTEMVINKGVPLTEIIQLFSYLLPTFFSITVPLSFLLGILLAFGRMSADSEFIALKASGVSLYSLVKPVILLAIICSLLTAWLTLIVDPASKTAFRNKVFQIASSKASVGIRAGIFNDDFDDIILYARSMDERRGVMQNVFISDEREGEVPATILAQEGRFIPDPENLIMTLHLTDGSIHRRPQTTEKTSYQTIAFTTYDINLNLGNQIPTMQNRHISRGEYSWSELLKAEQQATSKKEFRRYASTRHKRIAVAIAPLVFALVGVPLGLQSNRSGKGAGFALALAISLVYYLLLSVANTMARNGTLPVAAAFLIPNICFLCGGSYFLYRTAIERPLELLPQVTKLLPKKWRGGKQ
jgi:lipopolysaccharide export system permease protein